MKAACAAKSWTIKSKASAVNFQSEKRKPVLEASKRNRRHVGRQIGLGAEPDGLLPHPPKACAVEGGKNKPAFRFEHSNGFVKCLLRVRGKFQHVRKRH